jgi:hypothetical protein
MLNVTLFVLGWMLYNYLRMMNSLRSSSNSLEVNIEGMKRWLWFQHPALLAEAFLSAVLYPALVQFTINKISPPLQASGLQIAIWGFTGLAGFTSGTLLTQIIGLIPALRAEIPKLAPNVDNEAPVVQGSKQ